MSLSFETIMNASMTRKELTDIICPIKFCKCVILIKTTFCKCWDALIFMILSAILDYELTLRNDISGSVLKLL